MIASIEATQKGEPRAESRYRQLLRFLTTSELLRQFRFGVDTDYVNREVSDRTGDIWHRRTTERDLLFLESCGLVEIVNHPDGRRWKWVGTNPLLEQPPRRS